MEPKLEPQLFSFAEPEQECIAVPEPDIGPDPTWNVIQKSKNQNLEDNFLGNNADFSIEKARFCTIFLFLKNCAK